MKIKITWKPANKTHTIDTNNPPTKGIELALYDCAMKKNNVFIKTADGAFNIRYSDLEVEEI